MQFIKVAWFIDQLETYAKNDSSRCWNSAARFKGIMKFRITNILLAVIALWKTDNYSKTAESWVREYFRRRGLKNDDGNKSKKRRRPLSERDRATLVVYYSNGHAKWKMSPYKCPVKRWSWKASCRVTEDEAVGTVPSPSATRYNGCAIRFINNYSLCTRENYSLYPPSASTHPLTCSVNSSLFSSSIHLFLTPSSCAYATIYLVSICYCVFPELTFYALLHVARNNYL